MIKLNWIIFWPARLMTLLRLWKASAGRH